MNVFEYFFRAPLVELYEFVCGASAWRYAATSERAIVHDGKTFTPEYIVRTALHYSSDFAKDVLTVTLAANNPLAQLFFAGSPDFILRLTVYRGTRGGSCAPVWVGLVTGASFSFDGSAYSCELSCETAASRMERRGLARQYQLTCPHTLYGARCGVSKAAHASIRTVTDIAGNTVTVDGSDIADGYYAGGQAVALSGARRFVSGNAGRVITLERRMAVQPGDRLTLYPGCDKSRATCGARFGNVAAYGGFPWLPLSNPTTSSIG